MGGNKSKPIVEAVNTLRSTTSAVGRNLSPRYSAPAEPIGGKFGSNQVANPASQNSNINSNTNINLDEITHHAISEQDSTLVSPGSETTDVDAIAQAEEEKWQESFMNSAPGDERVNPKILKEMNKWEIQTRSDSAVEREAAYKETAMYIREMEERSFDRGRNAGAPTLPGRLNNAQFLDFMAKYTENPSEEVIQGLSTEYGMDVLTVRLITHSIRLPVFRKDTEGDTYSF